MVARTSVHDAIGGTTASASSGSPRTDAAPDAFDVDRRLGRLASLMDDRYRIPGTKFRVGLDGIIGLVPGIGDTATSLVSAYILAECWRAGVSKTALAKMAGNIGVEFVIGLVPIAGDIFDMRFKANLRNIAIARSDLKKKMPTV